MIYQVLNTLFFVHAVFAKNFDVINVIKISLSDEERVVDSYFGYSLLLQRGNNPLVIVGAPKQSNKTGGAVYGCDITPDVRCVKYNITTTNMGTFNGNFLGASIDGSDYTGRSFVACAPRKVTQQGTSINFNYYLRGSCFWHRNSTNFEERGIELSPLKHEIAIGNINGSYYYDYAFGQAGFDAIYDPSESYVIFGSTGINNWNGGIITQSLKIITNHQIIPKRIHPVVSEAYDYLGYKVTYGYPQTYLAGAPRADNLLGKVKLYHSEKSNLQKYFKGDEIGSYYGSAVLAEDVNDDKIDDLFVGAPTTAGLTYDEGCVFYYKNALSFSFKLTGEPKAGARFGTNIESLGDIDLDGFIDIAISAPFEDDGVGAVYIFLGDESGIKTKYSQKLSPLSFPNFNVKGFGMGISRGNDIDHNGHNDLAVGAYKSGHVFVFKTKSVIDFETILEANLRSISSTNNKINIKYCVRFKPRSNDLFYEKITFNMSLTLDYRVEGNRIIENNHIVFPNAKLCNSVNVMLKETIIDIEPFKFILNTKINENVLAEGTFIIEKSIPYAHGCGSDNICRTQILLNIVSFPDLVIWGVDKEIYITLSADNSGEPGYQCQLFIELPKQLQLREERKCTIENNTWVCPFTNILDSINGKTVNFYLDIVNIEEDDRQLNLTFEVKCMGDNLGNKESYVVPILVANSPYIDGISHPDNFQLNDKLQKEKTDIEVHHTFTLGNFGPSPVKSTVFLRIPSIKIDDREMFQLYETGGNLRGIHVQCFPVADEQKSITTKNYSIVKGIPDQSIVVDCFDGHFECQTWNCKGDYIYKSSEAAKYSLKFKINIELLSKFIQKQDHSKNILSFVTSAFLFNGTQIEAHAVTLIFSSLSRKIPLWIYIVSIVSGMVLLTFLIYIFYKCHFFDRRYKDKMNDELLMNQPMEMNTEIPNEHRGTDNEEI